MNGVPALARRLMDRIAGIAIAAGTM